MTSVEPSIGIGSAALDRAAEAHTSKPTKRARGRMMHPNIVSPLPTPSVSKPSAPATVQKTYAWWNVLVPASRSAAPSSESAADTRMPSGSLVTAQVKRGGTGEAKPAAAKAEKAPEGATDVYSDGVRSEEKKAATAAETEAELTAGSAEASAPGSGAEAEEPEVAPTSCTAVSSSVPLTSASTPVRNDDDRGARSFVDADAALVANAEETRKTLHPPSSLPTPVAGTGAAPPPACTPASTISSASEEAERRVVLPQTPRRNENVPADHDATPCGGAAVPSSAEMGHDTPRATSATRTQQSETEQTSGRSDETSVSVASANVTSTVTQIPSFSATMQTGEATAVGMQDTRPGTGSRGDAETAIPPPFFPARVSPFSVWIIAVQHQDADVFFTRAGASLLPPDAVQSPFFDEPPAVVEPHQVVACRSETIQYAVNDPDDPDDSHAVLSVQKHGWRTRPIATAATASPGSKSPLFVVYRVRGRQRFRIVTHRRFTEWWSRLGKNRDVAAADRSMPLPGFVAECCVSFPSLAEAEQGVLWKPSQNRLAATHLVPTCATNTK